MHAASTLLRRYLDAASTLTEAENSSISPHVVARKWDTGQNLTPAEAALFKTMVRSTMHQEIDQRIGDNTELAARQREKDDARANNPELAQLKQLLLRHGGSAASVQPDDPHLTMLIARGVFMTGRGARLKKGKPVNCHSNATGLWKCVLARICTGYALSRNDGSWIQHSWGLTEDGQIIETTVRRIGYFGVVLTEEESIEFAKHNPPW